jgi:hypothetical protein
MKEELRGSGTAGMKLSVQHWKRVYADHNMIQCQLLEVLHEVEIIYSERLHFSTVLQIQEVC